jgi:hypothetical protein
MFFIAGMGIASCENEKNTFSDRSSIRIGGDSEQSATADSVIFSFQTQGEEITRYDVNLKVYIAGTSAGTDRSFVLEIVDTASNAPVSAYALGAFTIPANAYEATIPVTVNRTVSGIDLTQNTAYLTFQVKENENFAVGAEEYARYKIVWCDYLIKPAWWKQGVMDSYVGPFSQARYKFILDYYGDLDLFEMGIANDGAYPADYDKLFALSTDLINLLNGYNATHATPYMNDDGVTPLKFGTGLTY